MVNAVVPHMTVEPLRNPVPVTVSVKAAPPATAVDGLREVILGPLVVKVDPEDIAALSFFTVTLAVPAEAIWAVVTAAVKEVALP